MADHTLTPDQVRRALELHQVPYFTSDGTVYAYESATRLHADGTVSDASRHVPAPTTRRALLAWLGY